MQISRVGRTLMKLHQALPDVLKDLFNQSLPVGKQGAVMLLLSLCDHTLVLGFCFLDCLLDPVIGSLQRCILCS